MLKGPKGEKRHDMRNGFLRILVADFKFEIDGVCAIRPMRLGAVYMGLMLKSPSIPTPT
jgi:hypothetical protein